jgi:hypothetical protein
LKVVDTAMNLIYLVLVEYLREMTIYIWCDDKTRTSFLEQFWK